MDSIPRTLLDGAEKRLPRWMVLFAVLGAAGFLIVRTPQMAAGFAAGAVVAILGFRWLERGVAAALDASRTRVPRSVGIKLMLRYPVLIAVLVLFYETQWLPIGGVILGLFVPAAGAIAESLMILSRAIFELRG